MELLKELCQIHAPSGEEYRMKDFLLDYISRNQGNWLVRPTILPGDELQDSLVLVFGNPRTTIFAHMDSVGYTVKYNKELVKIGGPAVRDGVKLKGYDSCGPVECVAKVVAADDEHEQVFYESARNIERGTSLTYQMDFRETEDFISSCYLDNRLGVYSALKVAETMENGAIAFTCWEEHGGGNAQGIARMLWERYKIRQALISDITWITAGVEFGKGVAISLRDSFIPRRLFVNKIIEIARRNSIPFQLEVENAGGSDGSMIQRSNILVDWCFIGAAEDNVHSPDEKVHKLDIQSMIDLYKVLMDTL